MTRVHKVLLLFVLAVSAVHTQAAEKQQTMEDRLREGLKNTMLQLRDAQGQVATLQAAQIENEQKIKDLTAQVETLTKQTIAGEKSIAELNTKTAEQTAEIARLNLSIEKWTQGYKQAAELAKQKEDQRAKLASDIILMQRRIDDQQRKNDSMFKLGNEILNRYERFGLGDALAAKEPFIGVTRVKFQNLVQNYDDQLLDNKIRP